MPSTGTPRNRLEKQSLGSNRNLWGAPKLNALFDQLDQSLDGVLPIIVSATAMTLTAVNFAEDQSRFRILVFAGVLTGDTIITAPGVQKWYWLINATSGAFSLSIKTAAGQAVVIPPFGAIGVFCDGVDFFALRTLDAGGQRLRNVATGTAATDAVNRAQMDAAIAASTIPGATGTARVSSGDTTPAFLLGKIETFGDIEVTITNPGADERLRVRRAPPSAIKVANWALAASDTGAVFTLQGSFTLSMTAAATLGAGWTATFRKIDNGRVTLDPAGGETIDGAVALDLYRGDIIELRSTGAGFEVVGGRMPVALAAALTLSL